MSTPQAGIFALGTRSHHHLEFVIEPDADVDAVRAALRAVRALPGLHSDANLVIGVGPAWWRRLAPDAAPDALVPFPDVPGVPVTQHDLWMWIHGTGPDVIFDVALKIGLALGPVATLAQDVPCFTYLTSRDLTGFEDGTENPPPQERHEVAIVPSGCTGAGGSFAMTQRWVHDLASFSLLDVADQEAVIGRTKTDSIELDEDRLPPDSHIARVVIEEDGDELEIFRRSVPYGTVAEHGLHFVAFSADPSRFHKMLDRMFGAGGDGIHDRLTEFTRPVTSSAWFVPSMEALADLGV